MRKVIYPILVLLIAFTIYTQTNSFGENYFRIYKGITNTVNVFSAPDASSLMSENSKARVKKYVEDCTTRYQDLKEEVMGTRKFRYKANIFISAFPEGDVAIGRCFIRTKNDKIRAIYLKRGYVMKAPKLAICSLMYHELGHCDLNLLHNDKDNIMNPKLKVYKSYKELDKDMTSFMELAGMRTAAEHNAK